MAANHFIRHFIQPPNFHNTDYWAGLTYINICTGRFPYGSIHAKKKRYVGEKHFKIHHETTQKQDRYKFFSKPGKHSVKGCKWELSGHHIIEQRSN